MLGHDGAARKHRDRKAREYRGLQSGDAVADRAYRPLLAGGAQRLERVMTVDASLRQHRQRKRLAQFRAAADAGDPHQRLAAHQFAAPELGLVGHQRDIDLIAFQRRVKMDAAGAAQLDFHVRVGARKTFEHFRKNIGRVEIRGSQRDVAGDIGCRKTGRAPRR